MSRRLRDGLYAALWALPLPALAQTATQSATDAADDPQLQPVLDILTMGRHGLVPGAWNPFWVLIAALLVVALLWAGLAAWRAIETDPERLRRSGLRLLRRHLAALSGQGGAAPAAPDLQGWLVASARAWQLPQAAPTPQDIAGAVLAQTGDAEAAERWRTLCNAVERQLYAASASVPADWPQAARSAYDTIPRPQRRWPLPDRRLHWLPAGALAVLVLALLPATPRAIAALADAAHVEALEAAGPSALAVLEADPLDWAARENVARVLIGREYWSAALVQGTMAFLQTASGAASRDNLRVAIAQGASADPALVRLFGDKATQTWPTRLAPVGWQRLALLGGLLLVVGCGTLLAVVYRRLRETPLLAAGAAGALIGVALVTASSFAWSAYGTLHEADAALLLADVELSPVPTNLVGQDQRTPLGAGSVVRVLAPFLGWSEVEHADGRRGWVRESQLQPIFPQPVAAASAP